MRLVVPLIVLFLLAGCDDLAHLTDAPKTLVVQADDASQARTADRILTARFGEYPASAFSSVKSKVEGRRITFTFLNGTPDPALLDYMLSHRGLFVAQGAGSVWFTDADIADTSSGLGANGFVVRIRLSEQAGARLKRISSTHVGEVVGLYFDGRLINSVRVREPIGKYLELDLPGAANGRWMAALLRHHALPGEIKVLKR